MAQPRVVLLSGQPAAGKTAITRLLRSSFTDVPPAAAPAAEPAAESAAESAAEPAAGAVEVDVDELIAFHPDLPRLRAADELTAEDLVHADARRWLDRAVEHLIGRRVNILLEHGLRSREVTDDVLHRFSVAGYGVEAVLLATPAAVSLLGNLDRYQVARETTGAGRFVAPELHDARYERLLDVADWLQDDPRVSAVSAYRRDGTRLMHNQRDTAGWQNHDRLRNTVQAERERPWTAEESTAFLTLHADLTRRMDRTWTPHLHKARQAAAPLLHPDAAVGASTRAEPPGPQRPGPQRPGPQRPDPQRPDPQRPDPQQGVRPAGPAPPTAKPPPGRTGPRR